MKIRRLAAMCAVLCLAAPAQAADPIVDSLTPGISFAEYISPTPVGEGQINTDTLFFIDELTGALGKSWYIFFDPVGSKDVVANITFDGPITGVFSSKTNLDGSNATYGAPGVTYGTSFLIGLESSDLVSFVGNVLTIDLGTGRVDPGDHIRVFTALPPIPEPETYLLLMAGLAAVGFMTKRRPRT